MDQAADHMDATCFICRKHAGQEAPPPGGYLDLDPAWRICHAPAARAVPGQLFVESRRHALDFGDLTPDEAAAYGTLLLQRVFPALKAITGAESIYALTMMDGAPHFHTWLVPRAPDAALRGLAFLAADHACTEDEALAVMMALRAQLGGGEG